jgi:hypothetical protein
VSTEAYLLWGLVFGSIGTGYFMYGKKRPSAMAMVSGIALMVYPYFINSTWSMIAIGILLMAIPWFLKF